MNLINTIDTSVYYFLFKFIRPVVTNIMLIITFFASAYGLIGITIILWLIFKNKKIPKYVTLNLVISFILNRILKAIIHRPRPQVLHLVIEKGYSFPSAHSMIGFAFYGFIIYLIFKSKLSKNIKIASITSLSLLIILIGISRVYLGVHYFSDVIGAFIVGTIYLMLFINFIYKNEKIIRKGKE